jgi:hypothetical protein
MGLKGYRVWVMGQLDSIRHTEPPHRDVTHISGLASRSAHRACAALLVV